MMKRLGTKLSSKSSNSQQSTSSSLTDSLFSVKSNHSKQSSRSHRPDAIPLFERQEIPPHTLLELRLACAAIVKETGPSGAELEAILNQADPLEQYKKEEQHRKDIEKIRLHAARTHTSAFPPVRGARERDRLSKSNLDSLNISSVSLVSPQQPTKPLSHKALIPAAPKQTKEVVELESPTLQRTLSRKPVPQREEERLVKARAQPEPRSKSALDDRYHHPHGPTIASSNSTTRSNTGTFDNHASTNQTSFAQTPADNKRSSLQQHPRRSSSRNHGAHPAQQDDGGNMLPETDFFSPNPDYEVPSLYHAKGSIQVPSRARSRAGSIKDSIFGGIRDYIQPRQSMERLSRSTSRQSRSTSRDPSATPSRSSSMTRNSKEWMRNAASSLRRKGSITSLRSQQGDDEDRGRRKDKGPDLNRKLPPLPGLDSYKEPKKHIAQLFSRSKFSSKPSTETPSQDLLSPPPPQQQQQQQSHQQLQYQQQQQYQPQYQQHQQRQQHQPPPSQQQQLTPKATPYMADQPAYSSQTITTQNIMSPDNGSTQQFPRIPFSDTASEERATSPRQWQSSRQRKASQDMLDKAQEDELRRVVREKIIQGALNTDAFDVEYDPEHRQRSNYLKSSTWNLEQKDLPQVRGKRSSHRRSASVKEGGAKKGGGFRGRFSKFMGHGHDQNSVIASY